MTPQELQRLLNLTAINLTEDEMPVFLTYFTQMKEMFDEFIVSSEIVAESIDDGLSHLWNANSSIRTFTTLSDFPSELILANIASDRLVGNAIKVSQVL